MIILGTLTLPTISFAQKGLSRVRVVRLSYVSGTVGVKRPASTEWAKALVNTPIQEGFEISTSAQSYAEVEFENGSTARLGEYSKLSFDQLAMDENGDKMNRLTFEQGYATFHFMPEHHDAYSVKMADTAVAPLGKSEFRADLDHGHARVEVFSGSVEVAAATKTVKLGKDKVLEFDPGTTQLAFNTTQGITKDSWDKWTSDRDTQEQLALADQSIPAQGVRYGWSDLDAYGEWAFFPGFGYGWSPFASMGWSPYTMGMWSWYPGMGYTWISGEPWGWMPYHYGSWNFSNGFGWFWMPGGSAMFSPALVSWYSGPGWIGWAPRGPLGMMGQNMIVAAPGGVIRDGLPVSPQTVRQVEATTGTVVTRLPFEPGAGAMLSGPPLAAGAETWFTPRAGATHATAPASVLVGGDAAKEQSLLAMRAAHQPLRARLGTTLGGQYRVGGSVGEFRGNAFGGTQGPKGMNALQGPEFSRGVDRTGPTLLSHGQHSSNAPQGGGGQMMSSGGGGVGNAGSVMSSASPASTGHSTSSSSSSSGGGHH
jgi:hypothetical protein